MNRRGSYQPTQVAGQNFNMTTMPISSRFRTQSKWMQRQQCVNYQHHPRRLLLPDRGGCLHSMLLRRPARSCWILAAAILHRKI